MSSTFTSTGTSIQAILQMTNARQVPLTAAKKSTVTKDGLQTLISLQAPPPLTFPWSVIRNGKSLLHKVCTWVGCWWEASFLAPWRIGLVDVQPLC